MKKILQKAIGSDRYEELEIFFKRYLPDKKIRKLVREGCRLSKRRPAADIREDYPVDFVVLWVDSTDENWLREKQKYDPGSGKKEDSDLTDARWRDWEMFRYWFRSVEKFAPWVDHIFFITYGHLPKWLNINHPKLRIVNHADYVPKDYLPTFNSNAIQLNLWRLKDLSEHFVLFDDDLFLNAPVKKETFFRSGCPKACNYIAPPIPKENRTRWHHILQNAVDLFRSSDDFDIRKTMEEHPEKWFSHIYRDRFTYKVKAYQDGYVPNLRYNHSATPMIKSSMENCCRTFSKQMDQACRLRFRSAEDLNKHVFTIWDSLCNQFDPVGADYFGKFFDLGKRVPDDIAAAINDQHIKCICLNDNNSISAERFEYIKAEINKAFHHKFPQKSSFER